MTKEPKFPEVPREYRPWTGDSGDASYPLGHTIRGHDVNELRKKYHPPEDAPNDEHPDGQEPDDGAHPDSGR